MRGKTQQGAVLAALAGICWGTIGTAQTMLPLDTSPLTIGAMRLLIGGIVLALWLWRRKESSRQVDWHFKDILIAAVGVAGLQIGLLSALPRTGVAMGTMITIGSSPIVAGVLGRIFFKEKFTSKWMIATGMAIVGCALIIFSGTQVEIEPKGILLALMGGCFYALGGVGIKGMARSKNLLPNIAAVLLLAAGFLLLLSLKHDFSWIFTRVGSMVAFYLGIMTAVLPYALFALALTRIPLAQTYTFGLTEPLLAFLLGIFLLKEAVAGVAMIGILILLMGLFWLAIPERKKHS